MKPRYLRTTLLNPPPEKAAAVSGMLVVPPTEVTLIMHSVKRGEKSMQLFTDYGQLEGNVGKNIVLLLPSLLMQTFAEV